MRQKFKRKRVDYSSIAAGNDFSRSLKDEVTAELLKGKFLKR